MSRDSKAKQIHLCSNDDHCSGIEINCIASLSLWALHQGWSEQLMECWLLLTLIIDSMGHWPMRGLWGPALTNQRSPSPLSTRSLLTNLMCKCCAGMDPTFLGQIHIKARILVTQAALGGEETLLSLSKQIISQVLSGKFVFSHTFTRLRCIGALLVETFSSLCHCCCLKPFKMCVLFSNSNVNCTKHCQCTYYPCSP